MIRTTLVLAAVGATAGAATAIDPVPATILAVVLLCCSAIFSGSETALFSLQPLDRQGLRPNAKRRIDALLNDPRRTLASILIGNEVTNITLSTVTAGLLFSLAPDKPWLNILVLTPILLTFGEVMPKVFALRYNRTIAGVVAPIILGFSKVVGPLRIALTRIADLSVRLTGGTDAVERGHLREGQFQALIDQGARSGSIGELEQEVIRRVFEFGDLTVSRLMTPRPDVFSLSLTTPWEELLRKVQAEGFSRIPIWQGNRDDLVGILLVKKLLPRIQAVRDRREPAPTPAELRLLLHPVTFVPTTKRAEDLLDDFRENRQHLAVVVDEHGSAVGVVTLDDLLAELVGELFEQTDAEEPEVTELRANTFQVRANMDVDDFSKRFGVELPEGEYTTISGFILAHLGEVPEKGAEFIYEGLRVEVSGMQGRRLTEVCIERLQPKSDEASA